MLASVPLRPVFAGDSVEGVVDEMARAEMFGHRPCDRGIVHMHEGETILADSENVDHGQGKRLEPFACRLVLDTGNDGVAFP